MIYRTESGDITLSAEGTQVFARVDDPQGSIQARTVNLVSADETVIAETDVRSVIKGGGGDDRRRPALFEADSPVNVTAARLDRSGSAATYSGEAQLWQGATSIKSTTLVLDEDNGNLTATGKVRTVRELEASSEERRGGQGWA